jgi:hypothetical protein
VTSINRGGTVTAVITLGDGGDGEVDLDDEIAVEIEVPDSGVGEGTFTLTGVEASSSVDSKRELIATLRDGEHLPEEGEEEGANACVDRTEFIIIKVEFVPAVSDVSDIPNIPNNGILPVSLSGADAKNKVRMKLKVTAPDGTYAFNLTSDEATKATVSPSTISVTTSGGSGTSADITVTGGTLSSSASDLVNITANMTSPGSGCSCTEDFVRYKFVSEMAYWGAWSATYSANVKGAGHEFDGDDYAVATTAMSGLTTDGYEAPTENNIPNADVWTQYSTSGGFFSG